MRVIVGDIHIVAADGQNIFVGAGIRGVGDHRVPGLAEIGGLGDFDQALVVLKPGGIHRLAVNWINSDLDVDLSRAWVGNHARRRPGFAVVTRNHEIGDRAWAALAAWREIGDQHVNVPVLIGGNGWFPGVSR